jgi:polyisoprenoid-binding protein YceI
MKTLSTLLAAALALALVPSASYADTSTWAIDAMHSNAGFAIKHLVISTVRGRFGKVAGTVKLDEKDITKSTVEATLDVDSIDTGVADRDGHLKSPDFFDVAKFPTITFKSTKVAKAKTGLKVTGDLTIHGVTKSVALDVATSAEGKGMKGETRRGFAATTKIARKDYGLVWNKMIEASPAVGDEVQITLDLEAVKDAPKEAPKAN